MASQPPDSAGAMVLAYDRLGSLAYFSQYQVKAQISSISAYASFLIPPNARTTASQPTFIATIFAYNRLGNRAYCKHRQVRARFTSLFHKIRIYMFWVTERQPPLILMREGLISVLCAACNDVLHRYRCLSCGCLAL
jgi:hypothetical protein